MIVEQQNQQNISHLISRNSQKRVPHNMQLSPFLGFLSNNRKNNFSQQLLSQNQIEGLKSHNIESYTAYNNVQSSPISEFDIQKQNSPLNTLQNPSTIKNQAIINIQQFSKNNNNNAFYNQPVQSMNNFSFNNQIEQNHSQENNYEESDEQMTPNQGTTFQLNKFLPIQKVNHKKKDLQQIMKEKSQQQHQSQQKNRFCFGADSRFRGNSGENKDQDIDIDESKLSEFVDKQNRQAYKRHLKDLQKRQQIKKQEQKSNLKPNQQIPINTKKQTKRWTEEENQKYYEFYQKYKDIFCDPELRKKKKIYKKMAKFIGTRNATQCRTHDQKCSLTKKDGKVLKRTDYVLNSEESSSLRLNKQDRKNEIHIGEEELNMIMDNIMDTMLLQMTDLSNRMKNLAILIGYL